MSRVESQLTHQVFSRTAIIPPNLSLFIPIGNVYFTDSFNRRIRKVTVSTGIITTIAGTGSYGYSGDDGAATSAALSTPDGVALDTAGTNTITHLTS